MQKSRPILRDYVEYAAVAALLGLTRLMPRRLVYGLFKSLALLACAAIPGRRRITLCNLRIAFPEMTENEQKRLARRAYLNIAEALALNTLIMTGRVTDAELLSLVDEDVWEALTDRLAAQTKGALVVSAHLGNWELLPQYAALRFTDRQIHVIARRSDNPVLERRLVMPLRKRFGMKVYYKQNALMHIVKASKRGEISALMLDQKLNPPEGFAVDFFGRPAPTGGSPALLQLRFGIPVIPVFLIRSAPRHYRVLAPDPVPWEDNGKPMEEQVRELTALHQAQLEEIIRQHPDQWFWMHNRWGIPKAEQ